VSVVAGRNEGCIDVRVSIDPDDARVWSHLKLCSAGANSDAVVAPKSKNKLASFRRRLSCLVKSEVGLAHCIPMSYVPLWIRHCRDAEVEIPFQSCETVSVNRRSSGNNGMRSHPSLGSASRAGTAISEGHAPSSFEVPGAPWARDQNDASVHKQRGATHLTTKLVVETATISCYLVRPCQWLPEREGDTEDGTALREAEELWMLHRITVAEAHLYTTITPC
jgi:hypothetical protein